MSLLRHVRDACFQHHGYFISLLRQFKSVKGPSTLSVWCLNIFILRQDEIVVIWVNVKENVSARGSTTVLIWCIKSSRSIVLHLSKQNQRELNSRFIRQLKMFNKQIIKVNQIVKMLKASLDYSVWWDRYILDTSWHWVNRKAFRNIGSRTIHDTYMYRSCSSIKCDLEDL